MTVRYFVRILALAAALASQTEAVLAQSSASLPQPAGRQEALRVIDAWLDGQRAYDHVPALSVGVVVGDELVWSKGYGTIDSSHRVPATPATIYSICSITKVFTAVAAMQLVEQKRLQLDESVATYLPWAQPAEIDPQSGPATLRGLLTHSAGMPREADFQYWAAPDFVFPTRDQIRARIAGQQTLFGAYAHYQYSNLGLTLVGEAVMAASSKSYESYVQTNLLDPLGLTDTRIGLPMALYGTRVAVGYGAINRDGTRDRLKPFDVRGLAPAAGLTSTVEDLAKFARWQFRLLRTGTPEVLQAATLRDMQRVQYTDPAWEMTRGLGFGVYRTGDRTLVGHSGECPGYFTSLMMHMPSETAAIVMMNAAQATRPYTQGIFTILNRRQGYEFRGEAPARIDLEPYAGRYSEQPWGSESVFLPWAGGLVSLSLPTKSVGDDMTFLKPKAPDIFRRMREDGTEAEEVRFERDASGQVLRVVWHNNPSLRLSHSPAPARPAS